MNILEEIAAKRKVDVEEKKKEVSYEKMRQLALNVAEDDYDVEHKYTFPFAKAIRKTGMSYICEVKKASPSKGVIAEDFPYLEIAKEYEAAGASAISCLTEPHYFLGKDEYLKTIAQQVKIPVLRKDFIVDAYQIYEAKLLGAAAVLLIVSLLEDKVLKNYIEIAQSLGMDALVEAHDKEEVERAVKAGAKIIGVNNRDLKTFEVDIQNSVNLRKLVDKDILFVSESGIKTKGNIDVLKENGTNAVLIGETLMRSPDKKNALEELNGGPL